MGASLQAERRVVTRRVSFENELAELPRYFAADGDLILSHVVAVLSSVFPDGEDYFVRSVRRFRDAVSDPELAADVRGFIGQESVHGREHRALNARLQQVGYATESMERITRKGLAIRERIMSDRGNLAVTAALEHFTATIAEVILSDPEARRLLGAPVVADLLVWHALEESEHKTVALDVYRTVGGTERTRRWAMNQMTVGFIVGISAQTLISLAGDRRSYRRGELRRSWQRLRSSPFATKAMWNDLRAYNREGFHPSEHDNSELVDHWTAELFGSSGRLNPITA